MERTRDFAELMPRGALSKVRLITIILIIHNQTFKLFLKIHRLELMCIWFVNRFSMT